MQRHELPQTVIMALDSYTEEQRKAFNSEFNRRKKTEDMGYLAWFFFGWHYAYVNKWGYQILYIFSGFGLIIWAIVDFFRIPKIIKNYNKDLAIQIVKEIPVNVNLYRESIQAMPISEESKSNNEFTNLKSEILKLKEEIEHSKNKGISTDVNNKEISETNTKKTNEEVVNLKSEINKLKKQLENSESKEKTVSKNKALIITLILFLVILTSFGVFYRNDIKNIIVGTSKKEIKIQSHVYKGKIRNRYPITMNIEINNNKIKGSYYYDKIGTPLKIDGEINEKNIEMLVKNKNGDVIEIFKGNYKEELIKGNWHNLKKSKKYKFSLKKVISQ